MHRHTHAHNHTRTHTLTYTCRRGTDVIKALALGAKAILLGKPVFFSLAVGGEHGVGHMLQIIREEFRAAMALCGCRTLADIQREGMGLVKVRPDSGAVFHRAKL